MIPTIRINGISLLINLPQAWDITRGSDDVVIAVVDNGIMPHPDLQGRLLPEVDFVAATSDSTSVGSESEHGTHIAGIMAAATDNQKGVAGVSWHTMLMPLRALDTNGNGTDEDISQAIRYAAGLPNVTGKLPERRANIINLSLGGPGGSATEGPLYDAIVAAQKAGVILIAAAGNAGLRFRIFPCLLRRGDFGSGCGGDRDLSLLLELQFSS